MLTRFRSRLPQVRPILAAVLLTGAVSGCDSDDGSQAEQLPRPARRGGKRPFEHRGSVRLGGHADRLAQPDARAVFREDRLSRVDLVRSTLTPAGPVYESVGGVPLCAE